MHKAILFLFILFSLQAHAQTPLISGNYDELNIAYDKETKTVTGFFESYTGQDPTTKNPMFSCIFYLTGKLSANKIKIKTYYPQDSAGDVIMGELSVVNNKTVKIHLPEEHGGCWNVQHFADEAVSFALSNAANWIQIRYANKDKVYFYTTKADAAKAKAYVVKGDVVYVEKIEGPWAFCSYKAKQVSKGWMKLAELNNIE